MLVINKNHKILKFLFEIMETICIFFYQSTGLPSNALPLYLISRRHPEKRLDVSASPLSRRKGQKERVVCGLHLISKCCCWRYGKGVVL